jgi:hypothetical protein
VEPGEAFTYTLTARLRAGAETGQLFLHFGRSGAYGSPGRKLRRYLRKVAGFTDSFFPGEGYLLPLRVREAWQAGLLLREEHRIEVPANAVPGTYRASLREGRYGDDCVAGGPLGFVEVVR